MAKRGTSYASNNPLMLNDQSWDRDAVMAIICEQIATSSNGLATILKRGHNGHKLPDYTTIMAWLAADAALSDRYARAKADQADYMADEMLAIADDATNDYMERLGTEGQPIGYQLNGDHVQRARLRLDTRKWLASKLKPKKYGEHQSIEHSGRLEVATKEQRDAAIAAALAVDSGQRDGSCGDTPVGRVPAPTPINKG